jgi:hypothetical protein
MRPVQAATLADSTSPDPSIRAVFLEFPIVSNFIISWATEMDDPDFLQDWQAALHRGSNQRYRAASTARPRQIPPAEAATEASLGSDEPLAHAIARRSPANIRSNTGTSARGRKVDNMRRVSPSRRVILREPLSSDDPMPEDDDAPCQDADTTAVDDEVPLLEKKTYHRRSPIPTGKILDPPCSFCKGHGINCFEEKGGGACVSCKKRKTRCTHSAIKRKRPAKKTELSETGERHKRQRKKTDSASASESPGTNVYFFTR